MEYNEYKAPKGKVLFNVEDFTYGHAMLSVFDLNLVAIDIEEAEKLSKAYNDRKEELRQKEEEKHNEVQDDSPIEDAVPMMLNEDGEYEEVSSDEQEDDLLIFKREKVAELLVKGVNFNRSQEFCTKKNTEII